MAFLLIEIKCWGLTQPTLTLALVSPSPTANKKSASRPSKRLPCREPKPLRHLERRRHRQEHTARGGRRADNRQPRRHTGRRRHFPCRTVFGQSGGKPRSGGQSGGQCAGWGSNRLCGGRECRYDGSRSECRLEQ